jgi:hypothetical protein
MFLLRIGIPENRIPQCGLLLAMVNEERIAESTDQADLKSIQEMDHLTSTRKRRSAPPQKNRSGILQYNQPC